MPVNLVEQRAAIVELVPEAIARAVEIMRRPGRNSISQLQVVKLILDRAGLVAVQDVQISQGSGGPIMFVIRPVESPPPQIEEGQ